MFFMDAPATIDLSNEAAAFAVKKETAEEAAPSTPSSKGGKFKGKMASPASKAKRPAATGPDDSADDSSDGDDANSGGSSDLQDMEEAKSNLGESVGGGPAVQRQASPLSTDVKENTLTIADLAVYFDLPISEAAVRLGLCGTLLKKVCRKNGIKRWPQRKFKSINNAIAVLEKACAKFKDVDQESYKRSKEELKNVYKTKARLMKNPDRRVVLYTPRRSELEACGDVAALNSPPTKVPHISNNSSGITTCSGGTAMTGLSLDLSVPEFLKQRTSSYGAVAPPPAAWSHQGHRSLPPGAMPFTLPGSISEPDLRPETMNQFVQMQHQQQQAQQQQQFMLHQLQMQQVQQQQVQQQQQLRAQYEQNMNFWPQYAPFVMPTVGTSAGMRHPTNVLPEALPMTSQRTQSAPATSANLLGGSLIPPAGQFAPHTAVAGTSPTAADPEYSWLMGDQVLQ